MITLTNEFHNTSITLNDKAGTLSAAQVKEAKQALCANSCSCSDFAGVRGKQYWGEGENRQQVWLVEARNGGAEIQGI